MKHKAEWAVVKQFLEQHPDMAEPLGTVLSVAHCRKQGDSGTAVVFDPELCAMFNGYVESQVILTSRQLLQDPRVVESRVRTFGLYALDELSVFAMHVRYALTSVNDEPDRLRQVARELDLCEDQEAWRKAV